MLQQTQVSTVIPYYERFVDAFPTAQALARAPLHEVLKKWEGLGYYARARNLHRAAREVADRWGGEVPSELHLLQKLPGVGRSTAGAIASLAYGKRAPILDGNVKRVLARWLAVEAPLSDSSVLRRLWSHSEAILPHRQPDLFNQALMDLGATVCTPRRPSCPVCPLKDSCRAFNQGRAEELPIVLKRNPPARRHMGVAVIQKGKRLLLIRRPEQGLLGGLWGLPEVPLHAGRDPDRMEKGLFEQWGMRIRIVRPLEAVQHAFTHLRMTYHPFLCRHVSGSPDAEKVHRWVPRERLSDYPFSAATSRILNRLPALLYPEPDSLQDLPRAAEPV